MPALVLDKGQVYPKVHGHGCAADRASGNQFCGDFHPLLFLHHPPDSGLIVIGCLVAGLGALPQSIIPLGIE